ncbi:MAG: cytochrome c peroxidase [Bacteroidetes bacterium]|nr:MAG: cytochrome c peroxidase [Bacteroidota bacterium]
MRRRVFLAVISAVIVTPFFFSGCAEDPYIPQPAVDEYVFRVPSNFPQPVYNFANNTVSEAGFKLGRKLFYDPILSRDNSTSCASCHQQASAFAHTEHRFSHGINDQLGNRNAPPVYNMAWLPYFMWDGGINHIESQPSGPITNPIEMDESLGNVIAKLSATPAYRAMFTDAFGDDTITTQRMFRAMAQFMGMMVSANSRYDKYMRGETGGEMNAQELSGLSLFRQKCASCHTEPLFSDYAFRNNGLAADPTINDSGRTHITQNPADMYKFKTPSLRNIELTTPYMHDGRFITLDQALNHYTSGVVAGPTLDPLLADGIPMTAQEKADIITFLKTLTDISFTIDHRFSEHAVSHEH